jgi:hypothetical protein
VYVLVKILFVCENDVAESYGLLQEILGYVVRKMLLESLCNVLSNR